MAIYQTFVGILLLSVSYCSPGMGKFEKHSAMTVLPSEYFRKNECWGGRDPLASDQWIPAKIIVGTGRNELGDVNNHLVHVLSTNCTTGENYEPIEIALAGDSWLFHADFSNTVWRGSGVPKEEKTSGAIPHGARITLDMPVFQAAIRIDKAKPFGDQGAYKFEISEVVFEDIPYS